MKIEQLLLAHETCGATLTATIHACSLTEVQRCVKFLGGTFTKQTHEGTYWLSQRSKANSLEITIFVPSVCTKHQTGTRPVSAIPAQPAHEEPIYEYRCEEILL